MNSLKRRMMWLSALALLLSGWAEAAAQNSTDLRVSGSPAPFTITTAVAGTQPTGITNSVTTYFVLNSDPAQNGNQKITAQLDTPMPLGTRLTLRMVASPGATSLGAVTLDAIVRDIVINIGFDAGTTYGITYVFTATVAAGVVPTQTRTVTFTLASYP